MIFYYVRILKNMIPNTLIVLYYICLDNVLTEGKILFGVADYKMIVFFMYAFLDS